MLAAAAAGPELHAAAGATVTWLAAQLQAPAAAALLHQLVEALQGSAGALATALPSLAADGLRPDQMCLQCGQLRGQQAALQRLLEEASGQVQGYQAQLTQLHLRIDNLLLDRRRLKEEAAEQVW